MQFNLDITTTEFIKIIAKTAQEQNVRVFFVGGIVRDYVLNRKNDDIDIIIEGNAIEFAKKLPNTITIKSIHEAFCTVKATYKNIEIDIASTRLETYPQSGCLPVVQKIGVNIQQDAKRRDFTINSLYCEITLKNNCLSYKIFDLTNGIEDIKNKKLRVLHNKSYIDDPTRILRGLEFKYRFDFEFTKNDEKLINEALSYINYEAISYDRTIQVFKKIFLSKKKDIIFKDCIEKKYYKLIQQSDLNIDFNKINKIVNFFNIKNKNIFYLFLIQNNTLELIHYDNILSIKSNFEKFTNEELGYYFYKTNDENILKFLEIKDIKTNITGSDLINLGIKQGKNIGKILNLLLEEKINSGKNWQKADEISWIKKNYLK